MNSSVYTGECRHFQQEPWKCDVILTTQRVLAAVSLLGCSFVLFTIWLFKRYMVTPQRMILFIALNGGGDAIVNMIAVSENKPFCQILGFLNAFFGWAMLLCALGVAVQLLKAVYFHSYSGRLEWAYHYVIWPSSLIISLLPFFKNKYGNSGVWCWIVDDTGWRMGTWYVPLFLIVIVTFILYIIIIYKLRKLINTWDRTYTPEVEANKKFLKEEVRPLVFYPCVYLVLYTIPLVNRIQNALAPDHAIYALVLLASMSVTMLGAVNSLVYGLDQDTRAKLHMDQIKTAWYSHFTPAVKVGEYNTGMDSTELSPGSDPSSPASNSGSIYTIEATTFPDTSSTTESRLTDTAV